MVKGGKGVRHHEVTLELTWRGLFVLLKSVARVWWTDDASSATATASIGVRRVFRILHGTTLRTLDGSIPAVAGGRPAAIGVNARGEGLIFPGILGGGPRRRDRGEPKFLFHCGSDDTHVE